MKKRRRLKKKVKQKLKRIGMMMLLFVGIIIGAFYMMTQFESQKVQEEMKQPKENLSREQFIGVIGDTARELAHEHDLYASVMIAQALLESSDGNSALASQPNYNLFGMKGHYKQQSVKMETQEDDGTGQMRTIVANFRKYPSYEASMKDYVQLMEKGVSWDKQYYHPTYKSKTNSYHDATAFLTGTYATDSRYNEKLNALIEQYDLVQYDAPITKQVEIKVKRKDTLDAIAQSYNVSETLLRQWNQLDTNILTKGQKIVIYEKSETK